MALLTAFNELNPDIEHEGLETVVRSYEGINVTDHDLYRFQVRIGRVLPYVSCKFDTLTCCRRSSMQKAGSFTRRFKCMSQCL